MLVRWNPTYDPFVSDFRSLQRQVDHVFAELFPRAFQTATPPASFSVEDAGDRYVIVADMPGISNEDLALEATDHSLKVSAKRELTAPDGYRALRRERARLEFEETFEFKSPLDLDKVEAKLEGGRLRIELVKQPKAQPRQIAVA
jgi:HSP20 family protein